MKRALVALLLVAAACGGGGSDKAATSNDSVTTTTTTASAATKSSSTTSAGGASTTTTAAGGATTTTTAAAKPSTDGGPAPVPKGTYHYKQTGSTTAGAQSYDTPPEGTMVVDAANDKGEQTLHRYVDPKGQPSDVTVVFEPDGIFLWKTTLRQGGQEITCTFDPRPATPPWPAVVGAKSSGSGDCGTFTIDIKLSITGTKQVTIDGASYDAVVVNTTITTTGQLTSTSTQVEWFVPALRLSTHTGTNSKGKFGTFEFSSKGTSDLVSAKPA